MKRQNAVKNFEATRRIVLQSDNRQEGKSPEEIRKRAFDIYVERGGIQGRGQDDSMQPEGELRDKSKASAR